MFTARYGLYPYIKEIHLVFLELSTSGRFGEARNFFLSVDRSPDLPVHTPVAIPTTRSRLLKAIY